MQVHANWGLGEMLVKTLMLVKRCCIRWGCALLQNADRCNKCARVLSVGLDG